MNSRVYLQCYKMANRCFYGDNGQNAVDYIVKNKGQHCIKKKHEKDKRIYRRKLIFIIINVLVCGMQIIFIF